MTDFYFDNIRLLDIELSNNCNASCPMCARNIHGWSVNPRLQLNELTIDDFLNIDLDLLDNVEFINISGNYGDPMMCRDVANIVHYLYETTSAKICLHTNGGLRNAEIWEQLGKVDRLEVRFGIDGLEDTNHLHRINVRWDILINNIKTYIKAGGNASWVYLIFFHNQHQVEQAKELAKELGFNNFKSVLSDRWRADNFPVLDKEGQQVDNLFPSTTSLKEYKQFEHRKDSSLNIDQMKNKKGYGYLRQRFDTYTEHNWKEYTQDDNQPELNCYANADKRLYIDANGYVFPCNSLGYMYGWANRYDYYASQILELLNSFSKEETNLKYNTLKNILNSNWLKTIHNTWHSKSIKEGRLLMCSHTCGKKSAHKMFKDHTL